MLTQNQSFTPHIREKLMTFTEGKDDLTDKIDFIVCLGGDGTLLYASSLFQQSVPPVMAFHLGSLGFLTPFEIDNFEQQITHVLEGKNYFIIIFFREIDFYVSQCSKIRKKVQFHKYKNAYFAILKMAKKSIFAPEKVRKLHFWKF